MTLILEDIKKSFGDGENKTEVLKGISCEIKGGNICVLLGPSGSGKSTLLNIIGGIENSDSGKIKIGDEVVGEMKEKKLTQYRRKHLGYVFQSYNLIPNLTVKENIEVGAYLSDKPLNIDELLKTLGLWEHKDKIPNQLSGGVGVDYKPEQPKNDIAIIGEGVRKKFEEILVPEGMGDVEIYTELGRYMLAPYGALVATAIHEKHIYKEYIGLDACAANLMRPAMYGSYHHITVLGKENEPCDHKYDVTGGLCENNDKFAIDRMLPKIDMGDIIYIHDAGAHGFSMGYNYNGKLRSAEVLLKEDGSHKLIRRAETPGDYFATFDFSDDFKLPKD